MRSLFGGLLAALWPMATLNGVNVSVQPLDNSGRRQKGRLYVRVPSQDTEQVHVFSNGKGKRVPILATRATVSGKTYKPNGAREVARRLKAAA